MYRFKKVHFTILLLWSFESTEFLFLSTVIITFKIVDDPIVDGPKGDRISMEFGNVPATRPIKK